jgi:hypothetical protein
MVDAVLNSTLRQRAGAIAGTAGLALVPFLGRSLLHIPLPLQTNDATLAEIITRVLGTVVAYHQQTLLPLEATSVPWENALLRPGVFEVSSGVLALGVVVMGLWLAAVRYATKHHSARPWLSDALWWLIPLSPLLQVVAVPTATIMSPRFLYMPMLGFSALASRAVATAWAHERARRSLALVIIGTVVASALMLSLALPSFRDNRTFFAREFSLHPDVAIISESYARSLSPRAQQLVLERTLDSTRWAPKRGPLLVLFVGTFLRTARDADTAQLQAVGRFFDQLDSGDAPTTFELHDRKWTMLGGPGVARALSASRDADGIRESVAIARARLGRPQDLVRLLEKRHREEPTPITTFQLAQALALSGRWADADALVSTLKGTRPSATLEAIRHGAKLMREPPTDRLDAAVQRARVFGLLGAPRKARQELALVESDFRDDPKFIDARVQAELDDSCFDEAIAILEAASREQSASREWSSSIDEVKRARTAWEHSVADELRLADPEAL